jgi:hypothetical protein
MRANVVYVAAAGALVVAAALIARRMSEGWRVLGPVAVLVLFASWALCVWLTPLGAQLWRASALGFVVAGAFLALSLTAARGVAIFVERPDAPVSAESRGTLLRGALWLILLMCALPVLAHLATAGLRLPS